MKKIRNTLSIFSFLLCSVLVLGQTRDNYVMMADLTGYPRTYDAAAEIQMDTIKQLLSLIDASTADFKVFETGVYRLNEYLDDAVGVEAKIKSNFLATYPNQTNYVLLFKLVNSKNEFASVKVISHLTISLSCFEKAKFDQDISDYFSFIDIDPRDLSKAIIGNLEYLKYKINKLGCCISNL